MEVPEYIFPPWQEALRLLLLPAFSEELTDDDEIWSQEEKLLNLPLVLEDCFGCFHRVKPSGFDMVE